MKRAMPLEDGIRQIRGACPLDCPDSCSWIVTVKRGQAVGLRGDPHHPYTRGALCNKVTDYLSDALSTMLFGLAATDAATFVEVAMVVAVVSVLACIVPTAGLGRLAVKALTSE